MVWSQTDAGASGVTPVSLDCSVFTDGFNLQIQYTNFGTTNLTPTVQVAYSLNGGAPVIENAPGLASGTSGTYTFASPVVFPAGSQIYQLRVWTIVAGDANAANDTIGPIPIPAPILATLPYVETFGTFTVGLPGVLANGWTRESETLNDWSVDDGTLNTTIGTGPDQDHTPNDDIFLYAETSNGSAGDTLTLTSPCIDLSGSVTPRLSFWYHMFGPQIGELRVYLKDIDNGTTTQVFSLAGQQQASEGAPWQEAQIDITSAAGNVVQVMFVVERGNGGSGDVGLDDVVIYQPQPLDMGASLVVSPADSGCYGISESAAIEVTNYGSQPIDFSTSPLTLDVEVNGPNGLQTLDTVISSGVLPVLGAALVTFDPLLDLSTTGTYTFKTYTTVTGDLNVINDTTYSEVISQITQVAPLIEDFETFVPAAFTAPGTMDPGWSRNLGAFSGGWYVEDGPTSTTLTGPSGNNTSGGSVYMYYESPFFGIDPEYLLTSPCYDLTALSNPKLSFYYHMYGSNMGTLEVDVVENGIATTVFSLSGQQQTATTDPWTRVDIDLAAYTGATIKLVFRAIPPLSGQRSDMAIDDINIFEPPAFDALADEITQPIANCVLNAGEIVAVKVRNFGSDTLTNIGAKFQVDAGPFSPIEIIPGILPPGDSVEYVFTATADLSVPGTHEITVVTTSLTPVDQVPSNDTTVREITNFGSSISNFPYYQSFEGGAAGWDSDAAAGSANTWALGTPAKDVIIGAASGTNAWVTGGLGTTDYANGEQSYVVSPCFDLTTLSTPVVRMDIWWEAETGFDGVALQSSVDGGASWQTIGSFGDPNFWYNQTSIDGAPGGSADGWSGRNGLGSNGWVKAEHELDGLGGMSSVIFRIAFGADISLTDDGFAFDNFEIFQKPPQNAMALDILSPVSGCGLTSTSTVEVQFVNVGSAPFTSIDLNFQTNGGSIITETMTGNFLPGDTGTYVFTTTTDMGTPDIYDFVYWTSLASDTVTFNDTLDTEVTAVPTIAQFPHMQDFESGPDFWQSGGVNDTWAFGTPDKQVIVGANSGDSAWVTGGLNTGFYNPSEKSYVIGPCFDFSNMNNPEIRMSIWYESEFSVDGAALQSSIDNGQTWQLVGGLGTGVNWYNDNTISGAPGNQQLGWTGRSNSSNGSNTWIFTQNALTGLAGQSQVRLRVVFGANNFNQDDGFAFDDIVIFDRQANDAGIAGMSAFPASVCLGDSTDLTLLISNFGTAAQSNIPVEILITGPVNDTLNGMFMSNIVPGDTLSYFYGAYAPPVAGTYELVAYTLLNGDTTYFHDSAFAVIEASAIAQAPITQGDTLCSSGNASLTLMADAGGAEVIWTNAPLGGRVVGRGDTLQTPVINSTSTFYALGTTTSQGSVGPMNNNFGLGSASALYTSGLKFDVLQTMVLKSVKVYPTGPGTIVVNLVDDNGTTLINSSFNYGGTGSDTTLSLEWFINPGLDYTIVATGTSIAGGGLYRNFSGVQYPYELADAVVIKSNALNQTIVYEYFYDWQIEVLGCPSPRVPATAVLQPPISTNLGFDGVQCEGYELDATNPDAISYMWNDNPAVNTPTITADTTGVYIVEVENAAGCTDRDTVVLFITPAPTATATADTSVCDSITLNVAPITGATYFWLGANPSNQDRFQTSFNVEQSGNYFVTVTKDGCTARDTISVTILPNPVVNLGQDQLTCDPVMLDAGMGASYLWSTGATSQTINVMPPLGGPDTISVMVTSADGCVGMDTVLVEQANPPMVDLGLDRSICGNESLDAGNAGSSFDWNTGATSQTITVDSSGSYAVLVTDANGCQGTDSVDIEVTPVPMADATYSLNTGSSMVNFTNNSTPADSVSYEWNFGDGVGTSTDKDPSYSYPVGGTYQVTLIVTNDCGSDTTTFRVENVPTGLENNLFQHGMSLYPNPSEGAFTLEADLLTTDEFDIEVTDARGRVVWQRQVSHPGGSFRQFIDLGEASEGIYLVRITGREQQGLQRVQVR